MKTTKRFRKAAPSSTSRVLATSAAPRVPAGAPPRRYETKLDQKKRVVLRGARFKYYEVNEKENGSIVLTPKKLVDIEPISARTMAMLESSIANLKKGIVSEVIDLSEFRKRFSPRSATLKSTTASRRKRKLSPPSVR